MTFHSSSVLAELGQPQALFDSPWLALLVILVGVAAFLLAVAAVGRWLAASHPDEPAKPAAPVENTPTATPSANAETPVEIFAAIAAAVAVTLGAKARIAAINTGSTEPAVETSRLQWSMEGRRQIYSSHKVR